MNLRQIVIAAYWGMWGIEVWTLFFVKPDGIFLATFGAPIVIVCLYSWPKLFTKDESVLKDEGKME